MKFQSFVFEKENALEFHKELNDKIWDKNKDKYILNDKVREKLLEIADAWVEYAKIPKKNIKNILFTGSLANFNYTQYSDVDLHILLDYDSLGIDFDFLYDYFKDKKALWAENHDITVKGYPVELYAQPMSERPHTNQGVYSISSNKWIQEPEKVEVDLEGDDIFNKKLDDYKEQIDDIIEGKGTIKSIEKFKEKIRKMRGAAIAKSGEFSQENLIFKSLRNEGYLDKLSKYHHDLIDKKLSLENVDIVKKARNLRDRASSLLGEVKEPGQEVEETENDIYERYKEYVLGFNKKFPDMKNGIVTEKVWVRNTNIYGEGKGESSILLKDFSIFEDDGNSQEYYYIKLEGLRYNSVKKEFVDYCRKNGFIYWWYASPNRIFIRPWKAGGDSNINEIVTEKK